MSKDEFTETPYAASFGPVPAQFNQEYSPTPPAEAAEPAQQAPQGPTGAAQIAPNQAPPAPHGTLLVPAGDAPTTAEPSEPSVEPSAEPSEPSEAEPHADQRQFLEPQSAQDSTVHTPAPMAAPEHTNGGGPVMDEATSAGLAAIENLSKIAITDRAGWEEGVQGAVAQLRSIQLKWLELEAERKVLVKPLTAAQGGYTRGVKRRGRARGRRRGRWRGV